jgi:phosphosulfolactate synthase
MINELSFIPSRPEKPREKGLTMMMDKGLSIRDAENFVQSDAPFTDLVKFGFGTGLITEGLEEKIRVYREGGLNPYFGGTLFEVFVIRNQFDSFRRFLDRYKMDFAEISDGSVRIPHEEKLEYIRILSEQVTVISEVGSKVEGVEISNENWIKMMKLEREAGSWKIIAEARENGTIGIYHEDGSANNELIKGILVSMNEDDIIWEAPAKAQQVWFIKMLGCNVNLGNIAPTEVLSLESLRLGLRGDTIFDFLPESYQKLKP